MKKLMSCAGAVGVAALVLSGCEGSGGDTEVAADCTPAAEFETITDGTLTVSVPELPPFTQYEDGEPVGADIDYVAAFAEANCKSVNWMQTQYAGAIPAVTEDRADMATGAFYRTEERDAVVGLGDPVYVDTMASISADGVTSIADMEEMNVGSVDGYLWVTDMNEVLGDSFTIYPSAVEMQADLDAGRIDVGLDSFGSAGERLKDDDEYTVETVESDDRVAASVEPAQITFPHTQDNDAMTEALNEWVATAHEDGTIAEVLESHGLPAESADTGEPRLIG
ncbi:substrate-binding periplasmic protein [Brevibacterium jeotgali]|uniref:Polar amino acid transport system substrate-binding protein n=1 Tax=Brevibacterium jeotgali TaxID=1262550 RepID=A0A2H1L6D0_9MICO|nr:transporter substrate-binding domain-containing protein [Brevibacterium jeotgali]TWB99064.1 amino acid ABC transporter substrate-binding protein (PAAT family) [Brevibacterium jeotgali]SMY12429.1 polar amino acid transport system substrate-binding protein [Brevibacterium jeotgali]